MEDLKKEQYTTEWCGTECDHKSASRAANERESHSIEKELARQLTAREDLEFESLVVRRVSGGAVCLEGVVRTNGEDLDLDDYIKALHDVDVVINRLVTRATSSQEETIFPEEETVTDWR